MFIPQTVLIMWKYYRPGLISLLFLPLLFIPFVKNQFHERDLRMLKLNLPAECSNLDGKESSEHAMLEWCNEDVYASNEVDYFSYSSLNDSEIQNLFLHLTNLRKDSVWLKQKSGNFLKAYVLTLSVSITYGEIVQLLNLCLKYDIKRYQLDIYKNNFVISELYDFRLEEEFVDDFEGGLWGCVQIIEIEPTIY